MKIGNKIRLLRKRKGITLKEISERTGFSVSFISQLERDVVSPSIESLKKICDSLDVALATFFDEEKFEQITNDAVVRKNYRKTLSFGGSKAQMFLLSPLNRKMELLLIVAQPGSQSGEEYHVHKGEECGLVLKGTMEVILEEGNAFILEEGDSFYFSSEQRHKWRNAGEDEAVSVWAITPPSF